MYLWKKSVWWDITAAACGRAGPRLHRPDPGHRDDLGQAHLGRLLGVGPPPDLHGHARRCCCSATSAVRRLPGRADQPGPPVGHRRPAAAAQRVHRATASVTWWRSLHQGTTILNTLQPKIHDQMAFTLVFCMFVVAMLFAWLLIHRWRLAWLEQQARGGRARRGHRRPPGRGRPRRPPRPRRRRRRPRRRSAPAAAPTAPVVGHAGQPRRPDERLVLRRGWAGASPPPCSWPTRCGSSSAGGSSAVACRPRTADGCDRPAQRRPRRPDPTTPTLDRPRPEPPTDSAAPDAGAAGCRRSSIVLVLVGAGFVVSARR